MNNYPTWRERARRKLRQISKRKSNESQRIHSSVVERSIKGKRGQGFLRELAEAMDAMDEKILIHGDLGCGDYYLMDASGNCPRNASRTLDTHTQVG